MRGGTSRTDLKCDPRRDRGARTGTDDHRHARPGYSIYADPSVSLSLAKGRLTLSTPVRIGQDFRADLTPGQRRRTRATGGAHRARRAVTAQASSRSAASLERC